MIQIKSFKDQLGIILLNKVVFIDGCTDIFWWNMSERTNSQIYLEELQSKFYTDGKQITDSFSFICDSGLLETMIKKWNPDTDINEIKSLMQKNDLPTIYEDRGLYTILFNFIEEIELAAKDLSFDLPMRPLTGTLPSGKVNAMAIKVPDNNEFILVFERELFTFANLIAKIVAQSVPLTEEDNGGLGFSVRKEEVNNYLKSHQEVSNRFNELILAYILHGLPSAAPPYLLDKNPMVLTNVFRNSLELFVVGHEYSHILLGHVQNGRMMMNNIQDLEVNEIIFNWENEHQADMLGLILMLNCMKKRGFDLAISYAGADIFFSSVDIIEKSVSILKTGSEINIRNHTHPPSSQRREFLRLSLDVFIGKSEAGKKAVKYAVNLAELFEYILKLHWDNITPLLYDAYKNGKKLDSRWLQFL